MLKLAYFSFYPADFVADTQHLTAEQVGAYIRILCFLWQKGQAKETHLKAVGFGSVNVGLSQWEDVALLLETDGNVFWSRRLEKEREKCEKKHKAQAENGKMGGRPKKNNPKETHGFSLALDSLKPTESNHNHNHIDTESSLRSLSASNADAHAEDPTPTPPARSFGQTPEQQADRNGPPTKERFLEYAQGNAGWIALGLTAAQWEEIWLYGVGIEWRMPSGQMISDWKHWGIAQGRKAKNNPRPQPKPAAQGFGSTPYGSGREEILRQMREHQAKKEAANAAAAI